MSAIGSAAQPVRNWTILYYFDGKNNLAKMATHSFDSLDQVGSNDDVNLVAQYGLPGKDTVEGLIEKGRGTKDFTNIGKVDMGSAANVQKFVEEGMKAYPAKHYALVLWDHGGGFKGSCTDDETNHIIPNADLAKALEAAQKNTGKKLEILNFNACLMNQAEVGYEMRNSANYMVGSEEVEAGLQLPLPGVFGTTPQHQIAKDIQIAVKEKGDLSGEDLAKLFVFEAKHQFGASMFSPTQAAIDLHKMDSVKTAADNLAGLLTDAMKKDPSLVDQFRSDIKKAQHFCAIDSYIQPYIDYHDLGDFARVLEKDKKFSGDPQIAAAVQNVKKAVYDAVIAEWHAPVSGMASHSLDGATGMSIFLTPHFGFDKLGKSFDNVPAGGTHGYETTSFAKDTKWMDMLKTVAKDDDLLGKFPKTNRFLEPYSQLAAIEGYQAAFQVLGGAAKVGGWELWPYMGGFPYIIPVPGIVGAAAGAIGGGLRLKKGIANVSESIRRDESPKANRTALAVNGVIDTAIGAGSVASCVALIAGQGQLMLPIAAGVMALGVGRMVVDTVSGLRIHSKAGKMTIDEKIDAMKDARPALRFNVPTSAPTAQPPAAPTAAPAAPAAPHVAKLEQPLSAAQLAFI